MLGLIVMLAGFFVAWNIGANDTANCIGTVVGGRVLTLRRALVLVITTVILGAFLEGWKNMKTIGEGVIIPTAGGANPLSSIPELAVAVLLAAGTWVFIATWLALPVSTSQSMVGAVIGAGLVLGLVQPGAAYLKYGKLTTVGLCWVLNPAAAAFITVVVSKITTVVLRRIKNIATINRIFGALAVVAAAYSAYVLGANDVGTSTGALYAFTGWNPRLVALFGAVALGVGAITFSRRVMYTVGTGITTLDPVSAFSAQFGAALTVWSFVQFAIPVSTSQAIVGAVAGAGLTKGASTVSKRKFARIGVGWVLTPVISLILSMSIGWILLHL